MGCSGRVFKALFGALALVGFIWLMLVGILESGGGANKNTTLTPRPQIVGREKVGGLHPIDHESDLNFMSKRRVPNGPDPIHNRRTGNSGRPPGQA